jgi:hypothetical protein
MCFNYSVILSSRSFWSLLTSRRCTGTAKQKVDWQARHELRCYYCCRWWVSRLEVNNFSVVTNSWKKYRCFKTCITHVIRDSYNTVHTSLPTSSMHIRSVDDMRRRRCHSDCRKISGWQHTVFFRATRMEGTEKFLYVEGRYCRCIFAVHFVYKPKVTLLCSKERLWARGWGWGRWRYSCSHSKIWF